VYILLSTLVSESEQYTEPASVESISAMVQEDDIAVKLLMRVPGIAGVKI
jgi:hypothetical protein